MAADAPQADPFAAAQEAVARYEQGMDAMEAAWLAGNTEEADRYRSEARALAEEALALFEQAGAPTSNDVETLTTYARACATTTNWDLAAEAYERALGLEPEQARLRLDLAEAWLEAGPAFHEDAFDTLRTVAGAEALDETERARALRLLGDLYWEGALYDAARTAYAQAVKHDADDLQALIGLAASDALRGEMAGASDQIDELGARAQPYDAEIRMRLRTALYEFEQMRRVFPETAAQHEGYGRLLYRAARVAESVMALRRATALDPQRTEAYNLLGDVQWQLGNGEVAIQAFEESLQVNPDQPKIREKLEAMRAAIRDATAAGGE